MEFTCPFQAKELPGSNCFTIKLLDSGDKVLFDKLIGKGKDGIKTVYTGTFVLEEHTRSYDQLKTVWKLIAIIFESIEGRKGTASEQYSLYLELLSEYASKVPCKLNGTLRPVHVSKSDPACTVTSAAYFIEGLMIHLSQFCDLEMGPQTEVRGLLTEWLAWRGGLEEDPLDEDMSEEMWRIRHPMSEASGKGGPIQLSHIVSRGADKADIEAAWNWLALTPSEHALQHACGWEAFLAKFPHLRGRVERARVKAGKLELVEGE